MVGMYGCAGGTARANEIVAPAIETPHLMIEMSNLETPELDPRWQSTIGLDDEFTQDGQGRIRGERLDASWNLRIGRGASSGEVTEADDDYTLRIEWANGVVFTREAP